MKKYTPAYFAAIAISATFWTPLTQAMDNSQINSHHILASDPVRRHLCDAMNAKIAKIETAISDATSMDFENALNAIADIVHVSSASKDLNKIYEVDIKKLKKMVSHQMYEENIEEFIKFLKKTGFPFKKIISQNAYNRNIIEKIQDELKQELDKSAWYGSLGTVQNLIASGVDVNSINKNVGYAPLHWATLSGHFELVQYLIEQGADIEACTEDGDTPLHLSVKYEHLDIFQYLLDVGATPDIQNKDGYTPKELIVMLRQIRSAFNQ